MRKKVVVSIFFCLFLGVCFGYISGRVYSYIHPMRDIEGYWEMNSTISHSLGVYHVYSRLSIINREVNSFVDVYDDNHFVKAQRNIIFDIVDANNNILTGKIQSVSIVNNDDHKLNDFLNTPYTINNPSIYRLSENTIFIDHPQGHPVNSLRLLTRINK
ncbi:hypothetical protein HB991_12735 [Yersinia mollaretii]|uniref:Uncharacterized protein n=1 Tax=Yersinia mollaretii TaxID=33060 RepID=A0AA44CMF5_YERMO|nr:hypothetical protein [Yersinia mollaretii]NIL23373.1 hypothetical protein [Yersinia mollaretii]CNI99844.1 Uncharacterised protein [Yersinia mollaretii]CNK37075.1 Uncharacterised protein [Yersinia enterocolitica]CQQ76979.1 Uncharacterised protein [Yersinia mollaretii]